MHDFGNVIWTRSPDSPKGHVSPAEGGFIFDRAGTTAVLVGIFTKIAWESEWPDGRYSSAAPWYAAGVAFAVMCLLGYLHYKARGPAVDATE